MMSSRIVLLTVAVLPAFAASGPTPEFRATSPETNSIQPPRTYDDMWPAWSPDGRKLVFTSTRDDDPEIYVVNADGTGPRRLTTTPGRDAHPFWSPDGTKIVFQSPREDGHTRIFVMDADGSNQRPLTKNAGFCGVPVWSPDGRHIVFQCTDDLERTAKDKPWQLFLMDADGGPMRQLLRTGSNDQVPQWSPDGKWLVFYSDRSGVDQLYTIDAGGGPATQVTTTAAANRGASWSRDGRHLIFHSERAGQPSDIYRMPSGGGEAVRLTTSAPQHGVPYNSPDGRTIAFQARSNGSWRIWLMDADGHDQRPLDARPAAPNASKELVLVSYSAEDVVALVSAETYEVVSTFPVSKDPHEIAVSRDGTRAYVATTGGGPGAVGSGPNVVTPLDLVNRQTAARLELGRFEQPHDVRVSADGSTLWVACAPAQSIVEIDAMTGRYRTAWNTRTDGGWFLAVTPDDRKIYVPHLEGKRVTAIDRVRGTVSTVVTGGAQSGIDISPDGRSVWVLDHEQQQIRVIDTASDQVVASIPLASSEFGRLRFAPDGRRLVLVQERRMMLFDVAARRPVGEFELPYAGKVVDVSPAGDRAVVSHPRDNRVSLVNLVPLKVLASIPTGKGPDGVAWIR